jgi:hypothetical protein
MQTENKSKRIDDIPDDFTNEKLKKLIDEKIIDPKYKSKANEVINFRLGYLILNYLKTPLYFFSQLILNIESQSIFFERKTF